MAIVMAKATATCYTYIWRIVKYTRIGTHKKMRTKWKSSAVDGGNSYIHIKQIVFIEWMQEEMKQNKKKWESWTWHATKLYSYIRFTNRKWKEVRKFWFFDQNIVGPAPGFSIVEICICGCCSEAFIVVLFLLCKRVCALF